MDFDPERPYGKGATIITQDNIQHAQAARAARQRIQQGRGTPQDIDLVNGREQFIKNIRRG